MFSSLWDWWAHDNTTAGVSGLIFSVILGYLDVNWTSFFLRELNAQWNTHDEIVVYICGTVVGYMVVFYS